MSNQGDITQILQRVSAGNGPAADELFERVYPELQRLARSFMSRESAGHTLQPTALVSEAYLKLVDQTRASWQNRSHFLAVAALAMRRILVNHALAKKAQKRGGDAVKVELLDGMLSSERNEDVLAVDAALQDLAKLNEQYSKVVECRFFGGLNWEETAEALGVSVSTVRRQWRVCNAWLRERLEA